MKLDATSKLCKYIYIILLTALWLAPASSSAKYWEEIEGLPGGYNLNYWLDVYFLPSNSNYGWICGFNGMTMRTTDGGQTWSGTQIPGADHLESIHFPTQTIGYCSGPDGIFKSENGGISWTRITPAGANSTWGCYFVNENDGVLLGGGCSTAQNFWRTIDGGSSWTLFEGNEPLTGLSDAIIYDPAGLGYASSSGQIWRTSDGGSTWDVFSNTGDKYWQEEIANLGTSFLVPNSGQTCQGAGDNSGEIRFSIDNGASWRKFITPAPMFGTFLTGTQAGWACGYDGFCYYTSDAGQKWTKRDCGIGERDLDDIWFINPDKGWVVGRGVWRLAPTKVTLHKNTVNYPITCVTDETSDTLYIRAFNFDDTKCKWDITGRNADEFEVPYVGRDFIIGSCLIKEFVIVFKPKTSGDKQATLTLQCNYDVPGEEFTFNVPLAGTARRSTVYPETDLIVYNRAPVGRTMDTVVIWRTPAITYFEAIASLSVPSTKPGFSVITPLPIDVRENGAATTFRTIAQDTGWQEQQYTFHLYPCDRDTTVTVRVYGISPIISIYDSNFTTAECSYSRFDTLKFFNNGNDDLVISQAFISENPETFSFVGFTSGKPFPLVVPPGKSDSIIIQFNPQAPNIKYLGKLDILSNDATKGGTRRTVHIRLAGALLKSNLVPGETVIDFGKVCVGDRASKKLQIRNTGTLTANVVSASAKLSEFKFAFSPDVIPFKVVNGSQAEGFVHFIANREGVWNDTIRLTSEPCDDVTEIIVRGEAVDAKLLADKSIINLVFDDSGVARDTVEIRAQGDTLTITSISLPIPQGWTISFNPRQPIRLAPGERKKIAIEITSANPTDFSSELCFEAVGLCDAKLCLPVNIFKKRPEVIANYDFYDFPDSYCEPTMLEDKITLANIGEEPVLVTQFGLAAGVNFIVRNPPALPYNLPAGDTLTVYVGIAPGATGNVTDFFIMRAQDIRGAEILQYSQSITARVLIPRIALAEPAQNFGSLQTCDDVVTRSFEFTNTGNTVETVTLEPIAGALLKLDFAPTSISINPGETRFIAVALDPERTGEVILSDSVYFSTTVCPTRLAGYIGGDVTAPKLEVTPTDINLGSFALTESSSREITITNDSRVPVKLDSIVVVPPGLVTLEGLALPVDLPVQGQTKLTVKALGAAVGDYTGTVYYYYSSVCPDSAISNLTFSVFEENFITVIKAGKYLVTVGDTLDVAISSSTAMPKLAADSVYMEFEFDYELFHPISARMARAPFTPLQMVPNISAKRLGVCVAREQAVSLFDASGDLILIHGLALLNVPTTTPIAIKRFEVSTRKNFEATLEDGLLTLKPFCYDYGDIEYEMLEGFELVVRGTTYDGAKLNIDSYSYANYPTDYLIYNSLGEAVATGKLVIPKGISSLTIPLDSRLANGVYKIVTPGAMNRSAPCTFLIVK